jgi:hypothetical protein
MPAQPIAARAGRQAILDGRVAPFTPMKRMVHFPIAVCIISVPAAFVEGDSVAAEVAMPLRFLPDLAELFRRHQRFSS